MTYASQSISLMTAERNLETILQANRSPVYNTAAVARRSGVAVATFRAWERRYGFPLPWRGTNNQRSYSEQDIRALVWLRERIAEGLTISSAVTLLREKLARPSAPPIAIPRALPRLASDLERALLAFDAAGASSIISEAFALHPFEAVCLEVIQTALVAIGQGWHEGRVETAQEHFASAFIRQRLILIMAAVPLAGAARLAVAACAPGDWHELGLLMVSTFLVRQGWRVIYLGANLPADSLAASLERLRPDALVLSATSDQTVAALAQAVATVSNLPGPPLIAFGGQPFEANPGLRDTVPGLYLGPTAATAIERLNQALNQRRS